MIVRNEEAHLAACLESVRSVMDEIVILDTGSEDRTKEIAARYTPHVYDYVWQDDFSAARNASIALAEKPFVMWLDADDVIDPDECAKLIALKAHLCECVDAVMMPYHYAFAKDGSPSLVFERERIVRRAAGFSFEGAVHEAMAVSGNVIHSNIVVRHTGVHGESSNRRNLAIYERMIGRGADLSARDMYYYARELKSAAETERAERAFAAFLEMDGWIENRIDAHIQRGECLMRMNRVKEARASLFRALESGVPRAEALCAVGESFLQEEDLRAAAHWYRAALLCGRPGVTAAFTVPDAYGYIPLMQLCVIFSRMGNDMEASRMNEQALLLKPGDEAALKNRAYFSSKLGAKKNVGGREKSGWGE